MLKYFAERLVHSIVVLLFASVVVFMLLHLVPGDPVRLMASPSSRQEDIESLRVQLGLDQPLPIQYIRWMSRLLQGDMGNSMRNNIPVSELIWPRYVNTIRLTTASMAIAIGLGITIGVLSSIHRNSLFDNLSMLISVGGFSVPPFWLGLILMLTFSVKLGVLPAGGGDSIPHIVLPSISLGVAFVALTARMTRSAMLEVLVQDYIRTARAKGLSESRVVLRHALKNAMIPVVTVIGLQFGSLMAGATVTETVFSWPGIGWLMVNSILNRDFPVVQATLLVVTATVILINLLVDIAYSYLNPRIKHG